MTNSKDSALQEDKFWINWLITLFLLVLVFIAIYLIFGRLEALGLINVKNATSKIEENGWIKIFNDGIRNYLVEHWRTLIALLAASSTFPLIKPITGYILKHFFKVPDFFYIPKSYQNELDFIARKYPLVGHSKDIEILNNLLRQPAKFSWMWVTGSGGSGKSRLLLEWVYQLKRRKHLFAFPQYDIGFLINGRKESWEGWKPQRPTIIIVDDASQVPSDAVSLFERIDILEKQGELKYPVRVIIVERNIPNELEVLNLEQRFSRHRFIPEPLIIQPLSNEDIVALAQDMARKRGVKGSLPPDIKQKIFDLSQGLPLFAIMAIDSYFDNGTLEGATKQDVIKTQYQILIGKYKALGLNEDGMTELALASFTGGLTWEQVNLYSNNQPKIKKLLIDKLFYQNTKDGIPPIKPDILAGFFLLERYDSLSQPDRTAFKNFAWTVAPQGVGNTLLKLAVDLYSHPAFKSLDEPPQEDVPLLVWATVKGAIIKAQAVTDEQLSYFWQELREVATSQPESPVVQIPFALGASGMILRHGQKDCWEDVKGTLKLLQDTANRLKDISVIQGEYAEGILNALRVFGFDKQWAEVDRMFQLLRKVAEDFRNDDEIQIKLIRAYASLFMLRSMDEDLDSLDAAFRSMAEVIQSALGNPEVQHDLSIGITNALIKFGKNERWPEMRTMFVLINGLQQQFPNNEDLQKLVAFAMNNFISNYKGDNRWEYMKQAFQTLQGIAAESTDDFLQYTLAAGTVNSLYRYGSQKHLDELRQVFDILQGLARRFSNNESIQDLYAEGCRVLLLLLADAKKWSEGQIVFDSLKVVSRRFPQNKSIQLKLAKATNSGIVYYSQAGELNELREMLQLLNKLARKFPDDRTIQIQKAESMAVAISGFARQQKWRDTLRMIKAIRKLASDFGDTIEIQNALAQGVFNAHAEFYEHKQSDHISYTVEQFQEISQRLQSDPEFEERYRVVRDSAAEVFAEYGDTLRKKAEKSKWRILRNHYNKLAAKMYEKAHELTLHNLYVLNNWGGVLMDLAEDAFSRTKAREYFASAEEVLLLAEKISNGSGSYNLACVKALQGQEEQCRLWLQNSLKSEVLPTREQALSDVDLQSVRGRDWFQVFCSKLKSEHEIVKSEHKIVISQNPT